MAQSAPQTRAARAVAAWLSAHEFNQQWLVEKAGIDPGTAGDFLNEKRWPKHGTQGKIERALGWPSGTIHQIGQGATFDSALLDTETDVGADAEGGAYVEAPGDRHDEDAASDAEVLRRLDAVEAALRDLRTMVERRPTQP